MYARRRLVKVTANICVLVKSTVGGNALGISRQRYSNPY